MKATFTELLAKAG